MELYTQFNDFMDSAGLLKLYVRNSIVIIIGMHRVVIDDIVRNISFIMESVPHNYI